MPDIDKVINGLGIHADRSNKTDCDDCPYNKNCFSKGDCIGQLCSDALALLKEQEQIKSPDEFKSLLLGMFDSIWDVEIDHPVFQDTVGELIEGVLQAYRQAVKWNE